MWLDGYFAGENPDPNALPLGPKGSDFQQAVWAELLKIPYGEVVTYGAIAKTLAKARGIERMSSQAVGGAVGRNPISIIIPCHRVVGSDGSLTGYGGGIENKVKLLEGEGVDMTKLYVPKKGTAL
jgi:methylated-DNA-[protein]-cysteine S-methyltransferase